MVHEFAVVQGEPAAPVLVAGPRPDLVQPTLQAEIVRQVGRQLQTDRRMGRVRSGQSGLEAAVGRGGSGPVEGSASVEVEYAESLVRDRRAKKKKIRTRSCLICLLRF